MGFFRFVFYLSVFFREIWVLYSFLAEVVWVRFVRIVGYVGFVEEKGLSRIRGKSLGIFWKV